MTNAREISTIEIDLFLEAVFRRYGYDFRHYARSSLKRRLAQRLDLAGLRHVSEMIPRILHDENFFSCFLQDMSITVTDMFRDPEFFIEVREKVIPLLKTYPFVNIWHAGCATGEEVYAMAIALAEEGFYDRARIYATDYNKQALAMAREGIYPLEKIRQYTANYNKAGGTGSLADYYLAKYESAKMSNLLKKNIVFSCHNLATDQVFAEMNLIICRNVLIYFDQTLQNRVLSLFSESLCHGGFLCLGSKESLNFCDVRHVFQTVSQKGKIFRKLARQANGMDGESEDA